MWGETTRVENRGETTRGGERLGGNALGAKRLVTRDWHVLQSIGCKGVLQSGFKDRILI